VSEEYEKDLNIIRENLEKAKTMKVKAETRLEQLNITRNSLLEELKSMDVSPENIEEEIVKLRTEIQAQIEKAKEIIPQEL
jgi:ParB-like chromosome segregation protein Spo0J